MYADTDSIKVIYADRLTYGTREMFWKYLKWKRVNKPGPDVPPWPYYDPDSQEYGYPGGPYPSLDELEDVKAWLDDMESRMYGTIGGRPAWMKW